MADTKKVGGAASFNGTLAAKKVTALEFTEADPTRSARLKALEAAFGAKHIRATRPDGTVMLRLTNDEGDSIGGVGATTEDALNHLIAKLGVEVKVKEGGAQ